MFTFEDAKQIMKPIRIANMTGDELYCKISFEFDAAQEAIRSGVLSPLDALEVAEKGVLGLLKHYLR